MPVAVTTQLPAHTFVKPTIAQTDVQEPWQKDLAEKGWAVIPGVISEEHTTKYRDAALQTLVDFGMGFKPDDPSTFDAKFLPHSNNGGLMNRYGIAHEQWAWDIRQEPAVIDVFAKIWGTHELLVSMDAVNLSIPLDKSDEKNKELLKPWPHVDQSPLRSFLHCVQGIANLADSGPQDGGLKVLTGSNLHFTELFEKFKHEMPEGGWHATDWWRHSPEAISWLENEKGCVWEKPSAPAGAVILWDSRTVHYGEAPTGGKIRVAAYICYKPKALITPEWLAVKVNAFHELITCTHDPLEFRQLPATEPRPNDPAFKNRPLPPRPVVGQRGLQLAGVVPY